MAALSVIQEMHRKALQCITQSICSLSKVDSVEKAIVATKVGTYKLHESTLDFIPEHFESTAQTHNRHLSIPFSAVSCSRLALSELAKLCPVKCRQQL